MAMQTSPFKKVIDGNTFVRAKSVNRGVTNHKAVSVLHTRNHASLIDEDFGAL